MAARKAKAAAKARRFVMVNVDTEVIYATKEKALADARAACEDWPNKTYAVAEVVVAVGHDKRPVQEFEPSTLDADDG